MNTVKHAHAAPAHVFLKSIPRCAVLEGGAVRGVHCRAIRRNVKRAAGRGTPVSEPLPTVLYGRELLRLISLSFFVLACVLVGGAAVALGTPVPRAGNAYTGTRRPCPSKV